jgi:hypothetical protein
MANDCGLNCLTVRQNAHQRDHPAMRKVDTLYPLAWLVQRRSDLQIGFREMGRQQGKIS